MGEIAKRYRNSVEYDAYIIFFATIRLLYFLKLTSPFFLVCKALENVKIQDIHKDLITFIGWIYHY